MVINLTTLSFTHLTLDNAFTKKVQFATRFGFAGIYAYADFHYVHAYKISIESTTEPRTPRMIVAQGNQHVQVN